MKKSVICAMVAIGSLAFNVNVYAASLEANPISAHVDMSVDDVKKDVVNYKSDGYVEIMTMANQTRIYASVKDHRIKQVEFINPGMILDGATIGKEFESSKMTYPSIATWEHTGDVYHTYKRPDGSVIMVTTENNMVVSLTEYSKTISNC